MQQYNIYLIIDAIQRKAFNPVKPYALPVVSYGTTLIMSHDVQLIVTDITISLQINSEIVPIFPIFYTDCTMA